VRLEQEFIWNHADEHPFGLVKDAQKEIFHVRRQESLLASVSYASVDLVHLILASKTALKNQCTQSVVFCSNFKIPSPKSSVNIHLPNPKKLSLFRL